MGAPAPAGTPITPLTPTGRSVPPLLAGAEIRGMYLGCMTNQVTAVKLTGGPSNGGSFKSVSRWPLYLHADGTKMLAGLGDRIMNGRSRAYAGAYVRQNDFRTGRVTGYAWRAIVEV